MNVYSITITNMKGGNYSFPIKTDINTFGKLEEIIRDAISSQLEPHSWDAGAEPFFGEGFRIRIYTKVGNKWVNINSLPVEARVMQNFGGRNTDFNPHARMRDLDEQFKEEK